MGLGSTLSGRLLRARLRRAVRRGGDAALLELVPEPLTDLFRRDGLAPLVPPRGSPWEGVTPAPLGFGVNLWLVNSPDLVRHVLAAEDTFGNDPARLPFMGQFMRGQVLGGLGTCDPPLHGRLRRILAPEFTARGLRHLEPRIRRIVDEQLDLMAGRPQPVDLLEAFAWPVPARTMCELLGIPAAHRTDFQRLSTQRFDIIPGLDALFGAVSSSLARLEQLIADERGDPGNRLLGTMVTRGTGLDDRTLAGLADGVLTGGLETTAGMLALGALVLLRDPRARERATDSRAVDGLVEDLLRRLSVVQVSFPRYPLRACRLGDHRVSEGDVVICSLLRANHDTSTEPSQAHASRHHLAFGHGPHRCLGAELARMELRIAYRRLVERFPRMRLAIDEHEVPFHRLAMVYGLQRLPVVLS
ncbi:cytochrome P450 [Streptoverticillium reticulum]|uniref:cytochrome P450 n=1 Tax=Streptoverticillium reticulum TaxID=1433415 RepID=UPI0039BF8AED